MASDVLERIIIFCHSPPWPMVGVTLSIIGGATAMVMWLLSFSTKSISIWATITSTLLGSGIVFLSLVVPRNVTNIKISCIQSQPKNSVENHHKNRFRISGGIGHLRTYVDIPNWVSQFEIKIRKNSDIDVIPFENKPNSVHFEDNTLKSDQNIDGFPVKLKLTGDSGELAEGEYVLEFVDLRTKKTIQRILLKCNPEPPDHFDEEELSDDELDAWL